MTDYTAILGLIVATVLAGLLLRWHLASDNVVDLTELICTDGKLNDKKFMRFGSWLVMTWVLYYMTLNHKLTEWYVVIYGGLWVSNALFDKWLRLKETK